MPADGLASYGDWESADAVITNFESHIDTSKANKKNNRIQLMPVLFIYLFIHSFIHYLFIDLFIYLLLFLPLSCIQSYGSEIIWKFMGPFLYNR